MKRNNTTYNISIVGYGNVAYRLSMSLKMKGHNIEYILGRNIEKSSKLAYILNKTEYSALSSGKVQATEDYQKLLDSNIVILAVSDDAVDSVAGKLFRTTSKTNLLPIVLHCSGSVSMKVLDCFPKYGVFYPLMTLSATKPVDFSIIPFFLEANSSEVSTILSNICFSLNAEYKFTDSEERARIHVAAVYVSNFLNYLTGLAFDLAKPNHMFLMPLAIETIRKAFLYEHPSLVQTGPAKRGDMKTIGKHLALLSAHSEHKKVYEILTKNIMNK